jgi:hypothetical protein
MGRLVGIVLPIGICWFWRMSLRCRSLGSRMRVILFCDDRVAIVTKQDLYEFLEIARRDEITAEIDFRQLIQQRLLTPDVG